MFRLLKIYLTITLNFTAIFALSYDTFILLEFENVSQSKTSDYLRHMLPDVIKDHNLDSHIKIEYAGEIEPYLGIDNEKYKNALIVLGQFSSKDFSIYVNIDVRDASSWKKINKFNFSCAYQDDLCFEKNMIDYSLTILNNLSLDSKNIEVLSENKIISENIDSVNSFYESLGNFAIEADLNNTWDKLYDEGNQYGKRYYKDIDKGFYQNIVKNSKEKNTEQLISFIDNILLNPYDVSIQDISMDYDQYDNNYINLIVPVRYTIKKSFIEDILATLPHFSRSDANGELIIKFLKSDFIFSSSIVDRFALMKYEVLPVLFLSDSFSRVSCIYIDSWKNNYNFNKKDDEILVTSSNEFFPLFAITPGEDNMQVNLDMSTLDITYQFRVPFSKAGEYSKIAIKFLYEDEIESLLDRFYISN
tara:strand:+ start:1374 stop:2627 length:1254 start_codon:yes stop_codon:yes gene_type:complete